MGEGGRLAGNAAKSETGRGIIVGRLQPAVVKAESLARRILQVELAVVAMREMPGSQALGLVGVQRAVSIKELPRVGEKGHPADIGAVAVRATPTV